MSFQIHNKGLFLFFQPKIYKVKYNKAMEYALIASNIIMAGAFALRYNTFPPQIPLFYSHQAGEDQLGEWWMIFLIPFFLNMFVLLNKFIYRKFFPGNLFVNKIMYYLNFFLIFALTLVFLKIVFLAS